MSPLTKRLDRLDGGENGRIEEMSDAQLVRIIRRGLSPAERKAYDAGTSAQREAILDAFAESFAQPGGVRRQTTTKSIPRAEKRP